MQCTSEGPCLREFFNIFKRQTITGYYQQLYHVGTSRMVKERAGSYASAPLLPTTPGTQEIWFLTDENGSFWPYRGPELKS